MAINFKKVAVIVGLSLAVIVVCNVLYVFERQKHQSNDDVGTGRVSDPSLKFVAIVCCNNLYFILRCSKYVPQKEKCLKFKKLISVLTSTNYLRYSISNFNS